MWPAFGMLFLAWPYGIVRVQQELGGAFINVTSRLTGEMVSFLRLPYERDAQTFVTTHLPDGENLILVISQLCSGTATFVGFGLIGLALMFMMRGRVRHRLRWFALGLALAFLANLVRLMVLLTLAVWAGARVAIEVVHPLLGLALFVVLLISMLMLLRAFGLGLELLPRGEHRTWEPVEGGGRPLRGLYAAAAGFAVLLTVLDAEAQDYSFLGVGDGAPAIDVASDQAILPDVDGWGAYPRQRGGLGPTSLAADRAATSSSTPTPADSSSRCRTSSPTTDRRSIATRWSSASSFTAERSKVARR